MDTARFFGDVNFEKSPPQFCKIYSNSTESILDPCSELVSV